MDGVVVTCVAAVEVTARGSRAGQSWRSLRQVCLLSAVMDDTEQYGTRLPKISAVYKLYSRNPGWLTLFCVQNSPNINRFSIEKMSVQLFPFLTSRTLGTLCN